MNKLQIIPRIQDANYFLADYDLLKNRVPTSKYVKKYKDAAIFTHQEADGFVLAELLNHATEDEIKENRINFSVEAKSEERKQKKQVVDGDTPQEGKKTPVIKKKAQKSSSPEYDGSEPKTK